MARIIALLDGLQYSRQLRLHRNRDAHLRRLFNFVSGKRIASHHPAHGREFEEGAGGDLVVIDCAGGNRLATAPAAAFAPNDILVQVRFPKLVERDALLLTPADEDG